MVSSSFLSWSENLHGFIGGSGQISTFLYFIGQQSYLSYIYRIKINHSQQYHLQKWTENKVASFHVQKAVLFKKTTPKKQHTPNNKKNTTKTHGHKKLHHPLQRKHRETTPRKRLTMNAGVWKPSVSRSKRNRYHLGGWSRSPKKCPSRTASWTCEGKKGRPNLELCGSFHTGIFGVFCLGGWLFWCERLNWKLWSLCLVWLFG